MELRQLEYFLELGRTRSFTKAAQNLSVSQPSITKAVQQLEQELGVTLFDRNQKPIAMTPRGQLFFERVSAILQSLQAAAEEVSRLSEQVRCPVRIGLSPWSGYRLKEMLADKAWAPPRHLLYNLAERSGPEVFRMLQTGALDLGWVIDVDRPRGLRFLPLETQEICCLLPRTSPLAQRERLTFPELASEAFAMNLEAPEDASVVSLLVARACREAGFMPKVSVNFQQFLPTLEVAQNLIEDGYGIMFGPAQAVQTLPRVAVRSMDPPLTAAVGVAWNSRRILTPDEQSIVDYLRQTYPRFLASCGGGNSGVVK